MVFHSERIIKEYLVTMEHHKSLHLSITFGPHAFLLCNHVVFARSPSAWPLAESLSVRCTILDSSDHI